MLAEILEPKPDVIWGLNRVRARNILGLEPLAGGARNCVPDMVVVSAWKPGLGLLEPGAAGTTSAL